VCDDDSVRRASLTRAISSVAVAIAMLAACSSEAGTEIDRESVTTPTTGTGAGSSTTASSTAATEPSTTLGDSEDTGKSELADGRHFGYWETFEIGDTVAFGEFDLAYFLSGTEAEKAAADHGDDFSNDYYVVNDNPKLRTLIVDGHADVIVVDWDHCCGSKPSTVADLAVERRKESGFWVTIEDGAVTKIEEQYVP
jgi:hypothetical protein